MRPLIVGTGSDAGLKLADPLVSRRHVELALSGQALEVTDLASTNGTWCNGSRVEKAQLPLGGTLCLGDSRLTFLPSADFVEVAPWPDHTCGKLMGVSLSMRRLFAMVDRLSRSEVTILLVGETGTGKDLIARELHSRSLRAKKTFTVVDCAAVAPNLIESELFGHEKGAFTGADKRHTGAFERTAGGTIFLDEIGELPIDLQPKLLRVLEDRTVQRVGGSERIPVDVRFIAATHRDLSVLIRENTFRSDLYYRLSVAELRVPALRDRPEDIPELVTHLMRHASKGSPPFEASPDTLRLLQNHDWPGNVRELRNLVDRAVAFGDERLLVRGAEQTRRAAVQIASHIHAQPYKEAKRAVLDAFERDYLAHLMERCEGNVSRAAREADLDRNHLSDLLTQHGLKPA